MRLAILLLAFAASIASAGGFNHSAFSGSGNFLLINFTHQGEAAQSLLLNGSVHAIFLPVDGTLAPSTDEILLLAALHSYYSSQGHSLSSLSSLSNVHEGIATIQQNRLPGEAKCRVLIGTDRNPCTDFLSCQKACYSVTSFCLPVALGSGRVFVNEVWLFENNSRQLSAAYGEEESAYAALASNATLQSLERYMGALSGINRAATRASGSALYDGYSYCAPPDYSLTQMTRLQLDARRIHQNASKLLYLDVEASFVRTRTLAGLERLALLQGNGTSPSAASPGAGANGSQAGAQAQEGKQNEAAQAQGNASSSQGQGRQPAQGAPAAGSLAEGGGQALPQPAQPAPQENGRRGVVLLAAASVLISTAALALAAGGRRKQRARKEKK